MPTYKGGIPKLRFGTDLAPDQEPLGKPLFLAPLGHDDKDNGMAVIGTDTKPSRDHLATVLAKRSTDAPHVVPMSAFAPDEVSPDGTLVRMAHETRTGFLYRTDRTTALGDDVLPTWPSDTKRDVRAERVTNALEKARFIAEHGLVEWQNREFLEGRDRLPDAHREEKHSGAYVCSDRDFAEFERRRDIATMLHSLGWPRSLAYDGTYA